MSSEGGKRNLILHLAAGMIKQFVYLFVLFVVFMILGYLVVFIVYIEDIILIKN